jgi:acetoin utilization protein AcuB
MGTRQIYKFMSVCTQTIGREQSLSRAHALMREHHVRHLPVVDGGILVGILSDGDLRFAEALRDLDTSRVRVEEVMTKEPYFVAPSAPLGEVAAQMAEHRYGCAVVMDGAKIAGIFTTTDALRALAVVIADEPPSSRSVGKRL